MKKKFKALIYACSGLKHAFRYEQNLRIELICAAVSLFAGISLKISSLEWCIIILCISCVLFLEVLNTSIERLCDRVHAGFDADIGLIKDLSAAAVLIASLAALACGALIFIPKIISTIKF